MKAKRYMGLLLALLIGMFTMVACGNDEPAVDQTDNGSKEVSDQVEVGEMILSTTTSTQDSGLLDEIIPMFEEETGGVVRVVAVGTGKALEMGETGEADVLLVHAKDAEEEFIANGYGTYRRDVMYNDFVLVGPSDDTLKLSQVSEGDVLSALKNISNSKNEFVSRGDDSGTHKMELNLWSDLGVEPGGDWYAEAGSGMADVLKMASEKQAYTLTDRASYLSMKDVLDLDILVEGDEMLFNQYGVIPVNPEREDGVEINNLGAEKFVDWITSEDVQAIIGQFGVEEFGQALFVPNAE